jgi:hypothetical protein
MQRIITLQSIMYKFIIIVVFAVLAAPVSAFSPSVNRFNVASAGTSSTRVFAVSEKGMQPICYFYIDSQF